MGDALFPAWGRVLYHLVCGEIDPAADWFETIIELREPFAVVYVRSPIVGPLREISALAQASGNHEPERHADACVDQILGCWIAQAVRCSAMGARDSRFDLSAANPQTAAA